MKSRIVIALSVTLAALLLVVGVAPKMMPTSPVLAQPNYVYRYSVPFVCGFALNELEGVKPANYATTVNLHNPQDWMAFVKWKVVRVFPNLKVSPFTGDIWVDPDQALCIRCKQICTKLNMAFPPPKYITGYVVIYSDEALDVTGVYTTEYEGGMGAGISIDVETYDYNAWYGPGP